MNHQRLIRSQRFGHPAFQPHGGQPCPGQTRRCLRACRESHLASGRRALVEGQLAVCVASNAVLTSGLVLVRHCDGMRSELRSELVVEVEIVDAGEIELMSC